MEWVGSAWGGACVGRACVGGAGRLACLVLQEEDDPTGGHQPQLLVKALGGADLTLHGDTSKAGTIQIGAVCEPRVSSRLGAAGQRSRGQQRVGHVWVRGPRLYIPGTRLVHGCVEQEGLLKVVETDHRLVERVHLNAAPIAGEVEGLRWLWAQHVIRAPPPPPDRPKRRSSVHWDGLKPDTQQDLLG